ncbi:MAG: hypothetical protein GF329_09395 [Candidatus Lokiarchaeota archaeon]|nr:hypothetical protein [Candidatus Lokiarchaeota archaeon]
MQTQVINQENPTTYLQFNDVFLPSGNRYNSSSSTEEFFILLDPILEQVCDNLQG